MNFLNILPIISHNRISLSKYGRKLPSKYGHMEEAWQCEGKQGTTCGSNQGHNV